MQTNLFFSGHVTSEEFLRIKINAIFIIHYLLIRMIRKCLQLVDHNNVLISIKTIQCLQSSSGHILIKWINSDNCFLYRDNYDLFNNLFIS